MSGRTYQKDGVSLRDGFQQTEPNEAKHSAGAAALGVLGRLCRLPDTRYAIVRRVFDDDNFLPLCQFLSGLCKD